MPLWAVILGWFFGCSGLLVLNAHLSELRPRLRISHVDEKTGLTWTTGLGTGQSPAYDNVLIIMNQLHANRLGINLVHNQQKVSRVVFKEAFNAGWRVGDEILEVDGKKVRSNRAIQNAVRRVVAQKKLPVNFKVRRWAVPDGSRGMIQLTNKGRREHLVPMVDIVRAILKDFTSSSSWMVLYKNHADDLTAKLCTSWTPRGFLSRPLTAPMRKPIRRSGESSRRFAEKRFSHSSSSMAPM